MQQIAFFKNGAGGGQKGLSRPADSNHIKFTTYV